MTELLWDYTQGIPHIAVILFYLAQARAVVAGREILDQRLIEKVFHEELAILHPMIKALQSGRKEEILKYSDLDIPTERFRSTSTFLPESEQLIEPPQPCSTEGKPSKYQQLVNMLEQMGIGPDIAPIVAEQAIAEKPDEDLFGLIAHIRFIKEKKQPPAKQKTPKTSQLKPAFIDNDLRLARQESATATYQQLKQMGIIIELSPYL